MTTHTAPAPKKIILHKVSKTLELQYADNQIFILPCAYLRAFSTSADMRKSHADIPSNVNILAIEPVGHYAIKPIFSDGHRTGIYSWETLYDLAVNQATKWPK